MKNNILIYVYYVVIILLIVLYDNVNASPNTIIRIGYLVALIAPLFYKQELVAPVIASVLCLNSDTYAYALAPSASYYYVLVLFLFALRNFRDSLRINPVFVLSLLYIFLVNLLTQNEFPGVLSSIVLCILLFFCIGKNNMESCTTTFPFVFFMISLAITYWTFFCENAQMETFHEAEGEESSGWMDANYLSSIVGIGCVLAIRELIGGGKNIWYKLLCIITIVGSLFTAAYAASRGGLLAVAFSTVVLVLFSKIKKKSKAIILGLMAALVFCMYYFGYFDLIEARVEMESEDVTNGRTEIWEAKLSAYFNDGSIFNWLFGFGDIGAGYLGGFDLVRSSHNDFVGILCRYGLIGLGAFLYILLYPCLIASEKSRVVVVSLLLYLVAVSMSLEPFALGYINFFVFYLYIAVYARCSQDLSDSLLDNELDNGSDNNE